MKIVILGLSITSSWGNGHAVTYRGLVRELSRRDHDVLFLERDVPWYADHRDMPRPPWGRVALYEDFAELAGKHDREVRDADLVIVGSFVPEGTAVGHWVCDIARGLVAFYDIDTPVTLAAMQRDACSYLTSELVPRYGLYLSFTGGPLLDRIETELGSPMARPLHCAVDTEVYAPVEATPRWDLGYMGTYSEDRQPKLEELLIAPAWCWPEGKFVVAGPQYPGTISWGTVQRISHVPPDDHAEFYASQRATLNITRADMVAAGWSPSIRLFEAAACGTPIITDWWEGLDHFLRPGREILVAETADDVLDHLRRADDQLARIGRAARQRVQAFHTAAHRARQLEEYVREALRATRRAMTA
jgi:spore maturation protein CgeB